MSLLTSLNRSLNDPLHEVGSRRAIGYFGWDVPVELILAAGAVPVQLSEFVHSGDTPLADRFLESSFSAQSRAVAQRWLAGDLDGLETVIFSRSDDSAQRLYYYLCELQRMGECKGPRPVLYDLARIQRGTSAAHTIESTQALATAIGVDQSQLTAANERIAARERLLSQLSTLRMGNDTPPGAVGYRIVRGARADWSEEFDRLLQAWLDTPVTLTPRRRVLLVGSVPSDDHVHAAIEVEGTVVVGELNEACSITSVATQQARHGGSPVERAARRRYEQTNAIRTLLQTPAGIVEAARVLRADGVIVWMLATDTGLAWEAPRMERALRDAAIPTLMLTSQSQTLGAEALTQIAQFRRTLEAR